MNKIYIFSLVIIFLIFVFIQSFELRRIYYSQDTVYLNNTVLLEKYLNQGDKKYLINGLAGINKIVEISMKFKNEEEDSGIGGLKIKTRTASGKNSIYVEALESISNSRKRNSQGFSFNFKDPLTGNLIRPTTMLEAHITCGIVIILTLFEKN